MIFDEIPHKGRLDIIEVPSGAEPADVLGRLSKSAYPFLLDTSLNDYKGLGHHSYMGENPFLVISSVRDQVTINHQGKTQTIKANPFDVLGQLVNHFKISGDRRGLPFVGGAVGYLSYELGGFLEELPVRALQKGQLPEMHMAFYDETLVFDHLENKWLLCKTTFNSSDKRDLSERARDIADKFEIIEPFQQRNDMASEFEEPKSNFSRDEYLKVVEKALEYIRAGDIYQVNLSQRFSSKRVEHPVSTYKRLRSLSPSSMGAYLGLNGHAILSSSPERFVKVTNGQAETRPIKGTRPRGRNEAEDLALKEELLASEKDRAELNMIVDVERNDFGRVCEPGTVEVPRHAEVESYSNVHHLVSTVTGRLRDGMGVMDLIKASFPGGSITGAPKIRSMEIIHELEPVARSVYTGSIGYIDFNRDADFNVGIRTMLAGPDEITFNVGGGIVADSVPEEEYAETLHKGKAMMETLRGQG